MIYSLSIFVHIRFINANTIDYIAKTPYQLM